MTDPREAKLPHWAQDTLSGLRRDLREARAEVTAGLEPPSETAPLVLNAYVHRDLRAVPRFYHVEARVPLTGRIGDQVGNPLVPLVVDVVDRGGEVMLEVRAGGNHSPSVVVHPSSSNVVRIEARRDR